VAYSGVVYPRPRRRRPGRWQTVLGLALIAAAVVIVADLVAPAVAANQLRSQVAKELQARAVSYQSLNVTFAGIPFLTQVAQGRYESIDIDMTEVGLHSGDSELTLPALHVRATGVQADAIAVARGDAVVTAQQVEGWAIVSYAGLASLVDLSDYYITDVMLSEQGGALHARATVSVLGLSLPIEAAVEVSVHDGQLHVVFRDAGAVGLEMPELGLAILDALVNTVIVAKMPPLPFGVTIDAFAATPDGLLVGAVGTDVILARPRHS
jgi:hypothetical protein